MKHSAKIITEYITRGLVGFMVGVVLYLVLVALYWLGFPYKTATIGEPLTILNEFKQVSKGGELELFLEINKESDYTPIVSRNIVCNDTTVHFVEQTTTGGVARPRGSFTAIASFPIPEGVQVGDKCKFIFNNAYLVNPLRTINKQWASEEFEIVE